MKRSLHIARVNCKTMAYHGHRIFRKIFFEFNHLKIAYIRPFNFDI